MNRNRDHANRPSRIGPQSINTRPVRSWSMPIATLAKFATVALALAYLIP